MTLTGKFAVVLGLVLAGEATAGRVPTVRDPLSHERSVAMWTLSGEGYESFWRQLIGGAVASGDGGRVSRVIGAISNEIESGKISGCVYNEVQSEVSAKYPESARAVAIEVALCDLGPAGRRALYKELLLQPSSRGGPEAVLGKGLTWMPSWAYVARRALVEGQAELISLVEKGVLERRRGVLSTVASMQLAQIESVILPLCRAKVLPDPASRMKELLLGAVESECVDIDKCAFRDDLVEETSFWLSRSGAKGSLEFLEGVRSAEENRQLQRRGVGQKALERPPGRGLSAIRGACHFLSRSSEGGRAWEAQMLAEGSRR